MGAGVWAPQLMNQVPPGPPAQLSAPLLLLLPRACRNLKRVCAGLQTALRKTQAYHKLLQKVCGAWGRLPACWLPTPSPVLLCAAAACWSYSCRPALPPPLCLRATCRAACSAMRAWRAQTTLHRLPSWVLCCWGA